MIVGLATKAINNTTHTLSFASLLGHMIATVGASLNRGLCSMLVRRWPMATTCGALCLMERIGGLQG